MKRKGPEMNKETQPVYEQIFIQSRSKVLSPVDEHFKLSTLKQTFLNPPYSTGKYRDGLTINGIEGFL